MPINFTIGMNVKVNLPHSYAHNSTGVITFLSSINGRPYADIKFTTLPLSSYNVSADGFWLDNLLPLNLTPEEQAQLEEERRLAEERRLDQERRQKHADQYL